MNIYIYEYIYMNIYISSSDLVACSADESTRLFFRSGVRKEDPSLAAVSSHLQDANASAAPRPSPRLPEAAHDVPVLPRRAHGRRRAVAPLVERFDIEP